jgi:RNA polymerase sigma-70 factor (sigma-E family)
VEQLEFEEFYRDSRDACLRAVLVGTGNPHLAEDLVAEAYAQAWSAWRKVRAHPAPRAWVVRTALNTHISWWRRHRREVALAGQDVEGHQQAQGIDPALMAALLRLPKRQREVVALRVFLDLDTEATAKTLGIAPGTVTAHLAQAVATLRGDLATAITQEGQP